MFVIDYYSNYPEFCQLSTTTAEHIIAHTKATFTRHGIAVTVMSDNGPQFSSQSFKEFAETYGFEYIT